jgi:hypothetical protein
MKPPRITRELTDEKTSPGFKEKWGQDAMASYWRSMDDTSLWLRYDQEFLDDMMKEAYRLEHSETLSKMEEGDFILPIRPWHPKF